MKAKKGKAVRFAGTMAMLIILIILIIPFFEKEEQTVAHIADNQTQIQRPVNPYITDLVNDYEKEVRKLINKSNTPGAAIAIVKDSTVVYLKTFGHRATNAADTVDENTVFRIASVSKCFASFLTGTLVQEGILSWDDPIVKYVPDFQLISEEQTKQLTIAHVLSHSTGLPYHTYTNLVEEGLDLQTLLSKLKEVKMSNDVGKEYSYQNVAFSVVAEVMKNATGKTYEQLMKERVFDPLGMKTASMDYATLMSNPNIAKPHRLARRRWVPGRITDTYYNVAPAGGINASISDMANWMKGLLSYRHDVISNRTLDEMFSPVIEARSKNRNYRKVEKYTNSYYGLGWRILHYPSDTLVYHGGYVNGYRSEVALDPNDKIAICILSNAPGQLPDKGIPEFFALFNEYRERIKLWDMAQTVPLPSEPL